MILHSWIGCTSWNKPYPQCQGIWQSVPEQLDAAALSTRFFSLPKHTYKTSVWIPHTCPGCLASAGWPQGESSPLIPRFPLLFIPWVEKEQNAWTLALSWCLGPLVVWILPDFRTAGGTGGPVKQKHNDTCAGVSSLCLHNLKGSCVWKSSVRKMTAWATSSVWLLKWEVHYFQHMNWLTIRLLLYIF